MERWWEPPPEPQDAPNGAHLFVCQHGLWGSPDDVSFLEQYLQHNGWLTLNARSNSARCTFDGADVCGDRLAAEVVSHVQRLATGGIRVTHISFAAYSFGGLIARYAVGKLLATGFFSAVAPVNFLTIATPHLGCWEHPSSMSQLAYNSILPWTLSRTGRQLLLADRWLEPEGLPLLAAMARPDCAFHAALAAFSKRVLLADIRSDRTVPYTTAAITAVNPYLPGGAATAPYTLPLPRTGYGGGGSGRGGCPGCAHCRYRNVPERAFSSSVPPLLEGNERLEGEEDEGGGTESDAFGLGLDLDDGDTDGDGGGAGAGSLLRGWSSGLPGFASVLSFGLGMASLLFRNGGGGDGGAGARAPARRRGLGEAWYCGKGCVTGVRCTCCDGEAAATPYGAGGASGQTAAAIIPLPISSAYPCIVTPHPAPAGPLAQSAGGAAGQAACPTRYGCGRWPPAAVAAAAAARASSGMHRSASSPLPKMHHATCCGYGNGDGHISCSGGGGDSSCSRAGNMAAASAGSARPVTATAVGNGAQLRKDWCGATSHSFTSGRSRRGGVGVSIADGTVSNHGYGAAAVLRNQPRQSRLYDSGLRWPAVTLPSLRYSRSSSAALPTATAARSGGSGSWFSGGEHGGDGGSNQDDALASRVRLGLFVALLPVLLSLWLCMVAWLAAIWIHHYAVLLTVRPDRSWDVRLRRSASAVAAEAAEATPDERHAGGGGTVTTTAPPTAAAPPGSVCGTGDGGGCGGGDEDSWGGEELTAATELLVSLTEAAPPSPVSALLLSPQQPRLSCRPEGTEPAAATSITANTTPFLASLSLSARGALSEGNGISRLSPATPLSSGLASVSQLPYSLESFSPFPSASVPPSGCSSRTQPGMVVLRGDPAPSAEATEEDPATSSATAGGGQNSQILELAAAGGVVHPSELATAGDPMTQEACSSAVVASEPEAAAAVVVADSRLMTQMMSVSMAGATSHGGDVATERVVTIAAATAAAAAAAPVVKAGATDGVEATADVRLLVRSIVMSVVRRYGGGSVPPAAGPVQLLGEMTKVAAWHLDGTSKAETAEAAANQASSDTVAEHSVVHDMVRAIFQSIASHQDTADATAGGTSGGDPATANIDYTAAASSATTMATQHVAMRDVSANGNPVIGTCYSDGASGGSVISLSTELSGAAVAAAAAAADHLHKSSPPLLPDHHQQQQQQQQRSQQQERMQPRQAQKHQQQRQRTEFQHEQQLEQVGSKAVTAYQHAATVSAPALRPQEGEVTAFRGHDEQRGPEQKAKDQPSHREAVESGAWLQSHDPAALLSEMIANLNQLEWQKVDVDTRHYHAHAAIVVRSSRRFRTHMHIIDYAVRQLRL